MGTGTDIAMESGGVTLLRGDLRGIVKARRLSRATLRNINQNLFFAFVYNAMGVPIAAGVLYPVFGILLSPMIRTLPSFLHGHVANSLSCPRVMAAPENIKAGFLKEKDVFAEQRIKYVAPLDSSRKRRRAAGHVPDPRHSAPPRGCAHLSRAAAARDR